MKIGIVGLGLIGGSIAKALKELTNHVVYGTDLQESVVYKAKLMEAIDWPLTDELLAQCELVIIALYPKDTVDYIKHNKDLFRKDSFVIDTCGVKDYVMREALPIAKEKGFHFVGGHPMAGVEFSGFAHSQKLLFRNASMILTPPSSLGIEQLEQLKAFWLSLGFTNVEITNPDKHDQLIAFTSQMAHVVSSAYVRSPLAEEHKGFSAGSYKDLTRVAKLNADMWTELFLLNREYLVCELDGLVERLTQYRNAIAQTDGEALRALLQEGTDRKTALDHTRKK